ncbi:SHOCT domain-containing protein [Sphingobium sp. H39-3-25]|uniref:SHOCT domain-containing protein n=1 Tax=Sphingobium arseniciresistens TaxID=3030834 RepID=UPI0023B99D01|nr:SHOCT domain-containing protein [Sphingobium arseniciresistens]
MPEVEHALADFASHYEVSPEAVRILLEAMIAGGGSQAQFNHPELGGMGQWSRGGMVMVGDMFNNGLKAKVGALAQDLAMLADRETSLHAHADATSQLAGDTGRWPAALGKPSSTGSQNDMHYAVFPDTRRLAIKVGGRTTVYDTADHRISGLGQQQGADQSITFTSQHGPIRLESLHVLSPEGIPVPAGGDLPRGDEADVSAPRHEAKPGSEPLSKTPEPPAIPPDDHNVIFAKLEGLADLHNKGILSTEEFAAKKTDLLGRL